MSIEIIFQLFEKKHHLGGNIFAVIVIY